MIHQLELRTDPATASDINALKAIAAQKANVSIKEINELRIIRRSVDARQKRVMLNLSVRIATGDDESVRADIATPDYKKVLPDAPQVIIVGAGPAGLFAALRSIELGMRPIIIERGADVDTRRRELARISREGTVDPDSNYCFGEGGAGAYSDGKLFTRSKKRGNVNDILAILHKHGAAEDILIDAHPHIGSDRLPGIIKNIRHTIINCGGEVRFNTRMTDINISGGEVTGITTADGQTFDGPVILATGHSARDTYSLLGEKGIPIEAKGLAIGVRLEHPQHTIDCIQYHSPDGRGKYLPPAEYSFVTQIDGRGVYSFCMCPGGVIVPAASAPEESVVNGMSPSNRGTQWANSGMVVEVRPGDFPEYDRYGEFSMMHLQKDIEQNFFAASGNTLKAPAQRMKDFTENKISATLPKSSYAPGIWSAPLHFLLPKPIAHRLQEGFKAFGRKSKGFLTNEAILVGLESRTSSPIRIPRDPATLQHITLKGLYPAGEGAGYAGGIVSAAIDGCRCADSVFSSININSI